MNGRGGAHREINGKAFILNDFQNDNSNGAGLAQW